MESVSPSIYIACYLIALLLFFLVASQSMGLCGLPPSKDRESLLP